MAPFNPALIYLITAGLCLIMLFADRTIQNAFESVKVSSANDVRMAETIRKLDDKYLSILKNRLEPGFEPKRANIEIIDVQAKAKGAKVANYKKRYVEIPL